MDENKEKKTSKYTNMEPNVAAALSYLVTPFTGIAFFVIEKEDKFVRFHAFQSILFGIAAGIAMSIASALVVLLIGIILTPLVSIASLAIYLLLMYKAYSGEMYELPYLGAIAKKQVEKH